MNNPQFGFIRESLLRWISLTQYVSQEGDIVVVLMPGEVATHLPAELAGLIAAKVPRPVRGSIIPPEFPFVSMRTKPDESHGLMLCLAARGLQDLDQIRFVIPRRWPRPSSEERWGGWSTYDAVKSEEHLAYANDGFIIVVGNEVGLRDWYFALESIFDGGGQGLTGRMLLALAAAQILTAPFDRDRTNSNISINKDSDFLVWLEDYSKELEDGLSPSIATHVPALELSALHAASTAHTRLCVRWAEYCRDARRAIDLLANGSTLPAPAAALVQQSDEVLTTAVRRLEQAADSSRRARDAGVALGSLLAAQTANSIAQRAAAFGSLALCIGILSVIVGFWGMNFEFFQKDSEPELFNVVLGKTGGTNSSGLGFQVERQRAMKEGVLPGAPKLSEFWWFGFTLVTIVIIVVGFGIRAVRSSRQRRQPFGGKELPRPLRY